MCLIQSSAVAGDSGCQKLCLLISGFPQPPEPCQHSSDYPSYHCRAAAPGASRCRASVAWLMLVCWWFLLDSVGVMMLACAGPAEQC